MAQEIVRTEEGVRLFYSRTYGTLPGVLLTMKDGSTWFHPYNGMAPLRRN